jgi:hypothetical protein
MVNIMYSNKAPPRKPPGKHIVHAHKRHAVKTKRIVPVRQYRRGEGELLREPMKLAPRSYLGVTGETGKVYFFRSSEQYARITAPNIEDATRIGLHTATKVPKIVRVKKIANAEVRN